MKYLLQKGRLIDPKTKRDEVVDVLIENGIIKKIAKSIKAKKDFITINLHKKIIAPGFIDMHVHLREPGAEHKETIETGTLSAIYGGFTAICCMPNTNPAIDNAKIVKKIISKSKKVNYGIVDVHPIGAATKNREGKKLNNLSFLQKSGSVGFSDDGAPIFDEEIMKQALLNSKKNKFPIIQHAEVPEISINGVMNEGEFSKKLNLKGIPSASESKMIYRDIKLTKKIGGYYHVAHISTKQGIILVRKAKKENLKVSCEVTPHHFTFTDKIVNKRNTNYKMNPPLRSKADLKEILKGLKDNTIEVLATDHAPHSLQEKKRSFNNAPFGIVGLETAIGLTITNLVNKKIISLNGMIEKFSTNPRRIVGKEIKIKVGEKANLTFIDPKLRWKVISRNLKSKSKNTPFNNYILSGKSIGVYNNGKLFLT